MNNSKQGLSNFGIKVITFNSDVLRQVLRGGGVELVEDIGEVRLEENVEGYFAFEARRLIGGATTPAGLIVRTTCVEG